MAMLVAFILMVFNKLRSVISKLIKKLLNSTQKAGYFSLLTTFDPAEKGEYGCRPNAELKEAELFSSILGRLGRLQEKVDILQAKASEMPHEKEELLTASICRVDALEAELIATKKVFLILFSTMVFKVLVKFSIEKQKLF